MAGLMAVDHDRIAKLLGKEQATSDTSLRAQSLKRATTGEVPHTLTPHEWEQWYAEHGVPESHTKKELKPAISWWRTLFRRSH
jgi:hypothetical protein